MTIRYWITREGSLSTKASFRYGVVMATTLLFSSQAYFIRRRRWRWSDCAVNARTRMHFVDNIHGRCRATQLNFATRFHSGGSHGKCREAREDGQGRKWTKVRGWAPKGWADVGLVVLLWFALQFKEGSRLFLSIQDAQRRRGSATVSDGFRDHPSSSKTTRAI